MKRTVSKRTYTKKDLINKMLEDYSIEKYNLENIINRIIHLCIKEINLRNCLKITNFGVFYKKTYKFKSGINFKTKEIINNIYNKPVVRCKFAKNIKYSINNKLTQIKYNNYSRMLSDKLYNSLNNSGILIHRDDCYLVLNEFFKALSKILIDFNRIEIRNFGVFEIRRYSECKDKNLSNSNEFIKAERFVAFFKGSKLSFQV